VSAGNVAVVELLLRHGANVDARDKDGYSAISMTDNDAILDLLKQNILEASQRHYADWVEKTRADAEDERDREERILRSLERAVALETL
jgi:hypothetical protein